MSALYAPDADQQKADARSPRVRAFELRDPKSQCIVGMTKLAPSLMPDGQRAVTVLVRV